VWLVELGSLAEPSLVAQTMATTFNVVERRGRTRATACTAFCTDVVSLDGCSNSVPAYAGAGQVATVPRVTRTWRWRHRGLSKSKHSGDQLNSNFDSELAARRAPASNSGTVNLSSRLATNSPASR